MCGLLVAYTEGRNSRQRKIWPRCVQTQDHLDGGLLRGERAGLRCRSMRRRGRDHWGRGGDGRHGCGRLVEVPNDEAAVPAASVTMHRLCSMLMRLHWIGLGRPADLPRAGIL